MKKSAIIVETRKYRSLEFVLNNVMSNLSTEWFLQIFHGRNNLEYIKDVINRNEFLSSIKNRILFNNLNIDSITQEETNLDIMLTEDFWNNVMGDTVLYFESDSMICSNSEYKVEDFEHFDYIGGYWGNQVLPLSDEYTRVMNGGISIRKKQYMLDIIKNKLDPYLKNGGNPCEDYFVSEHITVKPTVEQVMNFSIDNGYISPLNMKAPFALHKPWGAIPAKGHGVGYNDIKKVCDNVELLKSLQNEQTWWNN